VEVLSKLEKLKGCSQAELDTVGTTVSWKHLETRREETGIIEQSVTFVAPEDEVKRTPHISMDGYNLADSAGLNSSAVHVGETNEHHASLTGDTVSTLSLANGDQEDQWVKVDPGDSFRASPGKSMKSLTSQQGVSIEGEKGNQLRIQKLNRLEEPPSVEPWDSPPSKAMLGATILRLSWLEHRLSSKFGVAALGDKEERVYQREHSRLYSWKTVAEHHLSFAFGLHEKDFFSAFVSCLDVRKPIMASRFYQGAERDILTDADNGNRYTFLRLLNEAGSAADRRVVWACELSKKAELGVASSAPPKKYVIKCLVKNEEKLANDPFFYKREFVAQTVAGSFAHPNILPLTSYYETQSMVYTVLPLLDMCLFDQVSEQFMRFRRGFDEHVANHLFRQMYSGICFLGNIGLVHRDLSLENFCVTSSGRVQLIDFGLAAGLTLDKTRPGHWSKVPWSFAGKVFYMAPEIFNGVGVTESIDLIAADVWSLGVNLYCLIAGTYPWECPSLTCRDFCRFRERGIVSLLRHQIRTNKIADLHVSDSLLDLLARMLKIDVQERITIDEIRLHPFLHSAA